MKKVFSKKIQKKMDSNKEKEETGSIIEKSVIQPVQGTVDSDIAAIAMALHLHFDDLHEIEQKGFWLNRSLNYQSTWTAKNNLFRKLPIRKF